MITIPLKPLSVNRAWIGKHISTQEKKKFEQDMAHHLQYCELDSKPPYELHIIFHIPKLQDLDNCIKVALDCLMKHFGINDRDIYRIVAEKIVAKKGEEKIDVEIDTFSPGFNLQNK